jgi:5-methylthioadenosine/S-adenosylhomocysteine deaminase
MRGFLLPAGNVNGFNRYNLIMNSNMNIVDAIIEARWLLPIVPRDKLLQHQAVVIKDGVIVEICDIPLARQRYQASEVVQLNDHVLIPGLVNLHTHAAMSLMRGLADDLALMPWLQQHIWPAEAQLVSPSFVQDGTLLACAEMLSGGITTFNDMYFYPESAAKASLQAGMRANLGLLVLEFASNYAINAEDYIAKGTQARDALKHEPLISFSFAPHAPYTVEDVSFTAINTLSEQLNISLHTHLHETQAEIEQSKQAHGMRPLARLANLGLLSSAMTFAHCVHLEPSEIKLLAEHGCSIAHCPSSNLKLASGIASITECAKHGINIGLGTDGAASNNRLDMFAEMRLAALLAKGQSGDATAISAHEALRMATINGAKALNLEDKIGSIEIGKLADLTAVKLSDINMQPIFDVASHLVYVAGREQVSHVWVNGDLKYHKPNGSDAVYSNIEPQELSDIISKWQDKVAAFKAESHHVGSDLK